MGTVDDFLGSRLGLRSSRVSSHSTFGDHAEQEQLISSLDNCNSNETKKSQGRPWKAKREDYDYADNVFGIRTNENGIPMALQRTRVATQLPDQCVEAVILAGDTIAKVALRYNVPISELKRVNNLLNDAEFHALTTIKVPIKAASLLTELLPEASSGTLGRLGGETRNNDGWYVKNVVGESRNNSYLSDPASSPLTVSEASSEVEVGELIHIQDEIDNPPYQAVENNSTNNNCNSKQAKRVNRMLKNVDKDLARIKEREASRSISPDRSKSSLNLVADTSTVSLSLSSSPSPTMSSNDRSPFFSSTLGQQRTNVKMIHGTAEKSPWCSRNGLCCVGSIIVAVIIICLIAYHFDHSKMFLHSGHPNFLDQDIGRSTSHLGIEMKIENQKSHFEHKPEDGGVNVNKR